jgi:hypothetical protein
MTGLSVAAAIAAADVGPALTAELFPLSGVGKVRVTYNWLYSALNVDPNDSSPFAWVLQKNSDGSVALSPQGGYEGLTLFALTWLYPDESYRWVAQVQAPGVDGGPPMWNTSSGPGWTLTGLGLLTVELLDSDDSGNYIGVDGSITSQDDHAGYLILANAGAPGPSSKFFVAVQQNLQAGAQAPLFSSLSPAEVSAELERQGAGDPQALAEVIFAATGR